jgi:hypothetical protein
MTSLAINPMSIDHDDVPSTAGSSLPELDSAMFESEDTDDEASTQSSTASTTTSKKRKRKLKAVRGYMDGNITQVNLSEMKRIDYYGTASIVAAATLSPRMFGSI